ncbi:MAG: hypothetical protein LAP85_15310 [Acidobacteriia bacterium]|nr:hypothetical protein [Terriglobia bacterium]
MKATYKIPEQNLEELRDRIEKLNRRCALIGMPHITLTLTGEEMVVEKKFVPRPFTEDEILWGGAGGSMVEIVRRVFELEVEGETPKYEGWEFVAAIQHEEAGNILRTVPGFEGEIPQQYRTAQRWCDYCKIDRGWKDTYLVRHDDGSWKQVGRNCLKDFMGHANPHQLAEFAEILIDLGDLCTSAGDDDWMGGCEPVARSWSIETWVAITVAYIRTEGWVSRKEQDVKMLTATVGRVLDHVDPRYRGKRAEVINSDCAEAKAAIEWARNLPADLSSDYLWNLRVACSSDYVTARSAGIVCSLIVSYRRAMEREIERRKRFQSDKDSRFFGEVGKRAVYELTVTFTKEIDSNYGLMTLVKFRDQNGNVATWFASGRPSWFEMGETHKVKATVKKHELYQGIQQTILTRVAEVKPKPVVPEYTEMLAAEEAIALGL